MIYEKKLGEIPNSGVRGFEKKTQKIPIWEFVKPRGGISIFQTIQTSLNFFIRWRGGGGGRGQALLEIFLYWFTFIFQISHKKDSALKMYLPISLFIYETDPNHIIKKFWISDVFEQERRTFQRRILLCIVVYCCEMSWIVVYCCVLLWIVVILLCIVVYCCVLLCIVVYCNPT